MSILTSRQLAIVVWLILFLVWALTINKVREAMASLLKTLFTGKLLVMFGGIISYNVAMVVWLQKIGFWDPTMLYDTVIIIAVGGIGSVMRAATQDHIYDMSFYVKTILVNLEVMILLQFLSDLFPFSFWVEFFIFIPAMTFLILLVVFSEHQDGAELAHRFLTRTQTLVGLLLFGYMVWRLVTDYRRLLHLQVVFSLALPFVMSVLFVPVLYLACAIFIYENAFLMVSFKSNDAHLIRWKKWCLLRCFGFNLAALQTFRRTPVFLDFSWAKDRKTAVVTLESWKHGIPSTDVK
jgi:hypothetical protein